MLLLFCYSCATSCLKNISGIKFMLRWIFLTKQIWRKLQDNNFSAIHIYANFPHFSRRYWNWTKLSGNNFFVNFHQKSTTRHRWTGHICIFKGVNGLGRTTDICELYCCSTISKIGQGVRCWYIHCAPASSYKSFEWKDEQKWRDKIKNWKEVKNDWLNFSV